MNTATIILIGLGSAAAAGGAVYFYNKKSTKTAPATTAPVSGGASTGSDSIFDTIQNGIDLVGGFQSLWG